MDFGFLDQPDWWRQEREMGRVAFVSGLVVVCLLMLHGWSKVGGTGWPDERTQTLGTFDTDSPTMTPEAVTMTLDLAERYLAMGDAAQALHWLEEVIAHGTPKEVRHAKRLWRQALALIHGLSEPGSTAGEMSEPTTHRLAAAIEYDGTPFFGWQRQRQTPTVQECLENALSKVADHTVQVHASGRTDTGVHAWRQVVHFDVGVERSERSWILGTQTHLHPGVSMVWVKPVAPDFHARYSASSRHYCYRIINRIHRPAIDRQRAAWVHQPLDAQSMHEAAQVLVGEHDFSSFRAAGCQSKRATRAVHWVSVERDGDEIAIHIQANSFLYHMVRNITGSLMLVGRGERSVAWLAEVLAQKDRTQSGMTAPAHGLYFMRSVYPIYLGLPDEVSKPNQ